MVSGQYERVVEHQLVQWHMWFVCLLVSYV